MTRPSLKTMVEAEEEFAHQSEAGRRRTRQRLRKFTARRIEPLRRAVNLRITN